MSVVATYNHQDGYKFNIEYRTKAGFLRAMSKNKDCTLDHAVDTSIPLVIRMPNLDEYRKRKKA